jgi:7-cyano-7-deazaguanine synthase
MGYAISNGIDVVAYGAHSGDHAIYPDCRPEFVAAMQKLAGLVDYVPVTILAPFLHFDKGDIAAFGHAIGVNFKWTWTCYKGEKAPCGKCGACVERKEAFAKYQIDDPLEET